MTKSLGPALKRQLPFLAGASGIAMGALAIALAPGGLGLASGILLAGGGLLGASMMLDRRLQAQMEQLAAGVGEVKIRLAATNMRMEALGRRFDQLPMTEADAAPARATLAELSAEVGILGGLLQDVAQTLADHEQRLNEDDTPAVVPVAAPLVAPIAASDNELNAPVLRAEPDHAVQAHQLQQTEARAGEIAAALAAGQIEIHMQPIVQLPQRRTQGYEALVRLRLDEDTLLLPAEFMGVVTARGLASTLDALVLARALAIARHLASKGGNLFVSCNISPTTWAEPRALASLARLMEAYRDYIQHLVIEIPQRVFRSLDPASLGLLGAMSAAGIRFALDQVNDLRFDATTFHDRGIRFVKVAASLLMVPDAARGRSDIAAADLSALLARASIMLVAEKVEDDPSVADMIELGIQHAQGFAFAHPRLVKAEVFAEPVARVPEPEAAAPVEPAEPRVPFRAVLRRASA
ncbi:MAG: EAL domain-containing protein [Bosea sp. (in: a-proteobacteria)]